MLYESARVRLSTDYRIATLTLDLAGDMRAALGDLEAALRIVQGRPAIDVLVLRGSTGGLGVGFHGINDPETAGVGQRVAERLAKLDPITVAWIDGPCLGGALELGLACDYRIVAGRPESRLGFPQVRAGVVPCWGATVRLPRLVGLRRALDLLVEGTKLSAAQALAAGLVDRAFGPRIAGVHLDSFVLDLQLHGRKPRRRPRGSHRFSQQRQLDRAFAALKSSTSSDHRAAHVTLETIAIGIRRGPMEGLAAERAAAEQISGNAREAMNRVSGAPSHLPFERVAILGGGTIGAALAQWTSLHGCAVVVRDREPAASRERIREQFRAARAKRLLTSDDAERQQRAILCSNTWDGFATADLVIEATTESQSRKRAALAEIESVVRPVTVIATSSTVLPISSLCGSLNHPERLLGLHVAHPAASQRCIEMTASSQTDPAVLARMKAWLRAHGKIVVQTADRPGRVLGRVMLPYFHEALLLATEGGQIAEIDAGMQRFGFAWGPFAALDAVGLDVVRASLRGLKVVYGVDLVPPALIKRLTKRGWLGRKTGAGFYVHNHGELRVHAEALPRPSKHGGPQDAVTRLVVRLVNAAFGALGLQLADADSIDGLLVAAGWPAFRGGPIHYAESRGLRRVMRQMERLADQYGARFAPCETLVRLIDERRRVAA